MLLADQQLNKRKTLKSYIGKDFYKVLGISSKATADEIKTIYRKLARKYHPDLNKGNKASEAKFKEITEAYDVLSDEKKRRQYDLLNGNPIPNVSKQTKKQAQKAYTENKKTTEKKENKHFSDILDGFWKKDESKPTPKKERGSDITVDVDITPEEALNGTIKQINVLYTNICPKCNREKDTNCPICSGTNKIPKHTKLKVKIPPKVKENSKIRIQSEGNQGKNGGEKGDLFLIIHIKKEDKFIYKGNDILTTVSITPSEAALGSSIDIKTPDSTIVMKIPAETSSGQKLKITGEGLKDTKTGKKGDLVVTLKIQIPKNLTQKEKELYEELAKQRKENIREK